MIADAGNTKTAWVTISDRQQTGGTITEGISPYFNSSKEIVQIASVAARKLGNQSISRVFFFGSGCLKNAMQDKVKKALQKVFPDISIHVSDDLTGAGLALFGNRKGIIAISGTGSNAGVIEAGRIIQRTKSLGYLLGDEGSGADICFRFFKELLSNKLPDSLTSCFFESYALTPETLLIQLYAEKRPQAWAASFIPFLHQNRELEPVRYMLNASFSSMCCQHLDPLFSRHPETPLGFCGTVAYLFEPELRSTLLLSGKIIHRVIKDPIDGLIEWSNKMT